jgi:hypothetical protein
MRSGFRHLRVVLCRMLLGVMLFAQVINAANACVAPALSPAMAFANTGDNGHCNKAINGNSCLQQYTATDQSSNHPEVPALAASDIAVLTLPREAPATVVPRISTAVPHRATDPPPSVRFCSLQI